MRGILTRRQSFFHSPEGFLNESGLEMGLEGERIGDVVEAFQAVVPLRDAMGKDGKLDQVTAGFLTRPAGTDVIAGLPKESDIWSRIGMMRKS